MTEFKTIDEILAFAIGEEEQAFRFYQTLAEQSSRPEIRAALAEFAEEERAHKARLEAVRAGGQMVVADAAVAGMHLADILVDETPRPDMDYAQILVVAMKKEKAAFDLYTALAQVCPDVALRDVFRGLAQEEARHQRRFEVEYDEVVLKED